MVQPLQLFLAHAILEEAYKVMTKENSRDLKFGINQATEKVVDYLNSIGAVIGEMIDQVATISTNNDPELGKIIADAFRSVDETGVVMMRQYLNCLKLSLKQLMVYSMIEV